MWSKNVTELAIDAHHLHWTAVVTPSAMSDTIDLQIQQISHVGETLHHGEQIRGVYPTQIAWLPDQSGFFYDRELPLFGGHGLYFHEIGREQQEDHCVIHYPDQLDWHYQPVVNPDGRWLLLTIFNQSANNRLALYPLHHPFAQLANHGIHIVDRFVGRYDFVAWEADYLLCRMVDQSAPNGRLIKYPLNKFATRWEEVVPSNERVLMDAVPSNGGNRYVLHYLRYGASQLVEIDKDGGFIDDISLPDLGTVEHLTTTTQDVSFIYSDLGRPPMRYTWSSVKRELLAPIDASDQADQVVSQQVWVASEDGVLIPVFIAYRADLEPTNRPTIMIAYGGLGVSFTPRFSVLWSRWLACGGTIAHICARGGGELGAAWHQSGVGKNKQNTFDDVLSTASWLQEQGFCTADHLGLWGASNGGLTAGACLTQAPEQFGAVVIQSGLLDMLDYDQLGCGENWVPEYGAPYVPAERVILGAYSPLHQIKHGTNYPATLILTHAEDPRVGVEHSVRFATALSQAQAGPASILLQIMAGSGHDSLEEKYETQLLGFFAEHLELDSFNDD